MTQWFLERAADLAVFSPQKMGKCTLVRGEHAMLGLNAFEGGQEHAPHAHAGADKAYLVLEGTGEFRVGEETRSLGAGALVFAPAGVEHGVRNPGSARLVLLVFMAPPPAA